MHASRARAVPHMMHIHFTCVPDSTRLGLTQLTQQLTHFLSHSPDQTLPSRRSHNIKTSTTDATSRQPWDQQIQQPACASNFRDDEAIADRREATSTEGDRARRSNRSRRPTKYHPPAPLIAALSPTVLESPGQPPDCPQQTPPWHLQSSTLATSSVPLSRRAHSTMLRSPGTTSTHHLRPARALESSARQSMKKLRTPMTTRPSP